VVDNLIDRHETGDVVSVPLCEFSSDYRGIIGEIFALSSQGKISIKAKVPFVFLHVEKDYAVGWIGRCHNDSGLRKIPSEERPKYIRMCTEGAEGPKDDKSHHEQLEVIPSYRYPSILESTTYIFAGELVRVKLREDYVFWGKLHFDHFLWLHHLHGFLMGLSSDVNQIPDEIGLDVRALRRVRTPTASMGKGYLLRLKDHMASQTQSAVPQAPVTTHVAIPSFGFSGLPTTPAQPPATTVKTKTGDYNSGTNLDLTGDNHTLYIGAPLPSTKEHRNSKPHGKSRRKS
jgi:hypothetical protein